MWRNQVTHVAYDNCRLYKEDDGIYKGVCQRDIKGAMEEFFFTAGFPQRGWQKVRFVLVQTLLVWLKSIQNYNIRIPFRIGKCIGQEIVTLCWR